MIGRCFQGRHCHRYTSRPAMCLVKTTLWRAARRQRAIERRVRGQAGLGSSRGARGNRRQVRDYRIGLALGDDGLGGTMPELGDGCLTEPKDRTVTISSHIEGSRRRAACAAVQPRVSGGLRHRRAMNTGSRGILCSWRFLAPRLSGPVRFSNGKVISLSYDPQLGLRENALDERISRASSATDFGQRIQ
jgi:hypothetical protein